MRKKYFFILNKATFLVELEITFASYSENLFTSLNKAIQIPMKQFKEDKSTESERDPPEDCQFHEKIDWNLFSVLPSTSLTNFLVSLDIVARLPLELN